ncbi:helix-turn-helix domain-containing protein [Microbispora amethystogenes]|uniref:helix-turn-helix domain-containing protein n=1 Tax=Microbispora amethystogenes TaxID=1427754 RepID=UPI0033D5938D
MMRRTDPLEVVKGIIDAKVPPDQHMLETEDVAKAVGITPRAVLNIMKDGKLGHLVIGKRGYRIPRALLEDYLLQSFVPAKVTEAEQALTDLERTIELAQAKLDELDKAIERRQAKLANPPAETRRPTQAAC